MIAIVDYGAGNIASIKNMLRKLGSEAEVCGDPDTLRKADKVILPGVGHFDHGMQELERRGLVSVLREKAIDEKVPFLGICLGLQLMTRGSEEGEAPGLEFFAADTRAFDRSRCEAGLRFPHMGWAIVREHGAVPLAKELPAEPRYYFVHAFHVVADREEDVLFTATHGYEFAAGLQRGNMLGVQFHPEKSHKFGMALLRNFIERY